MKINYQNFGINYILKRKIKRIFECTLKSLPLDFQGFSVNLKIVNEDEIKKLNNTYRKIDKVTDVLSFPYLNLNRGKNFALSDLKSEISSEDGLICLGDIAICKKIAKIQAKNYGHSARREMCFLALHGLLHLLGFDHETENDEQEMFDFADKILKLNKVER